MGEHNTLCLYSFYVGPLIAKYHTESQESRVFFVWPGRVVMLYFVSYSVIVFRHWLRSKLYVMITNRNSVNWQKFGLLWKQSEPLASIPVYHLLRLLLYDWLLRCLTTTCQSYNLPFSKKFLIKFRHKFALAVIHGKLIYPSTHHSCNGIK